MDRSSYSFLFIVLDISNSDLVPPWRKPLHAEDFNLYTLGIYNSYGPSLNEIKTRYSTK